ncbi:MAG: 23S rRNA (pseudouridine(1915)-N(3))-methyltransferase RlmH [Alphaproteobacteria bacterium]|nr:23S rRNA (pseudouridine(1915)-N(3))-methyltransferase RlmH [Alphaproteobacteria bacterium]
MDKLILLTGGKISGTPEGKIFDTYLKRLTTPIKVIEIKQTGSQAERIFEDYMTLAPFWVALDEHGKNLTSPDFSNKLSHWMESHKQIGFMIGIDTGIPKNILERCQEKIAFGQMTWPHLLVRVMFIEQLYRAQQIMRNHPYHKI